MCIRVYDIFKYIIEFVVFVELISTRLYTRNMIYFIIKTTPTFSFFLFIRGCPSSSSHTSCTLPRAEFYNFHMVFIGSELWKNCQATGSLPSFFTDIGECPSQHTVCKIYIFFFFLYRSHKRNI